MLGLQASPTVLGWFCFKILSVRQYCPIHKNDCDMQAHTYIVKGQCPLDSVKYFFFLSYSLLGQVIYFQAIGSFLFFIFLPLST